MHLIISSRVSMIIFSIEFANNEKLANVVNDLIEIEIANIWICTRIVESNGKKPRIISKKKLSVS